MSHLVVMSSPAVGEERLGVPGAATEVSGVGHVGRWECVKMKPPRSGSPCGADDVAEAVEDVESSSDCEVEEEGGEGPSPRAPLAGPPVVMPGWR